MQVDIRVLEGSVCPVFRKDLEEKTAKLIGREFWTLFCFSSQEEKDVNYNLRAEGTVGGGRRAWCPVVLIHVPDALWPGMAHASP
jgi:hypothetical protein